MADVNMVRHRRPRLYGRDDRQETDLMDDEERQRYRFSTDNIDRLVGLLEPSLRGPTRRTNHSTTDHVDFEVSRFRGFSPDHRRHFRRGHINCVPSCDRPDEQLVSRDFWLNPSNPRPTENKKRQRE
ncbi:hypothetical protein DPMN_084926 [Dreissena polymorpha]|uniref:Uncharacterized protein n=1 Tax=Dreissena polymorpha TaxID=45954 RepID=A0A9D3YF84_DREPO|nr:hypothetical protein DPMN_084926 [Dreissena polymorpha]